MPLKGHVSVGVLLAVILNEPIRSVVDLQALADLGKVTVDLRRMAGMLKLWLSAKKGMDANTIEVQQLMNDFRLLQIDIFAAMSVVV
ncbi:MULTISPECIES: hypothetical protein [Pseudomonas]|uniref:hypothetical protein n=1 Tax=Pseudomonas guariconensis TaxID=1288410 RepID=UPI002096F70D|nr:MULTISPECIES: hypothetical protein [Pseudomonas]MCO7593041.1 hypothetical protein [Pseudomonas guariconensis]MCU7219707.1 hypothetical protein [Pseudomonas brassicacearum]